MSIAENLQNVRARIAQTAVACGRKAADVCLIAVSKKQPVSAIRAAYEAGQRDFGENYAQELMHKAVEAQAFCPDIRWHFIGPLQSNKVNMVLKHATVIHTIQSLSLAESLSKRCHREIDVLIQVNVGREPQKSGVMPEDAPQLVQEVQRLPHLKVVGLMTIPPDTSDSTSYFRMLAELGPDGELSMGMSHDFETAIAWGATMVRVGSAIFGARV